ncbi:MAG: iron-sulfur cluster assembly scaffold protein [Sandaracinobacter sp.]
MDAPLYNARILRLAASIPHAERLTAPQATARRTSQVCGSRVTADVVLGPDKRITAFGQEVRACALGQASAAILGQGVLGETAATLTAAHDRLKDWLKGDGPLPQPLADCFAELALFEPARAHPARHPSILLAFEAAAAAAAEAEALALQG